jgi:hypothetical protein
MTSLTTAQLRQALEISKRCDTYSDQLAAVRASPAKTFSSDIHGHVGRMFVLDLPRGVVEDQLLERQAAVRAELEALGITHLETKA